jgi:hypothetical protein
MTKQFAVARRLDRDDRVVASGRTKIVAPNVRQKDVLGITQSGTSFGSLIRLKTAPTKSTSPQRTATPGGQLKSRH